MCLINDLFCFLKFLKMLPLVSFWIWGLCVTSASSIRHLSLSHSPHFFFSLHGDHWFLDGDQAVYGRECADCVCKVRVCCVGGSHVWSQTLKWEFLFNDGCLEWRLGIWSCTMTRSQELSVCRQHEWGPLVAIPFWVLVLYPEGTVILLSRFHFSHSSRTFWGWLKVPGNFYLGPFE